LLEKYTFFVIKIFFIDNKLLHSIFKNLDFNYDLSEKEEIASGVDCNGVRISTKLVALGMGASMEVANAVAWSAYYQCMALTLTKP